MEKTLSSRTLVGIELNQTHHPEPEGIPLLTHIPESLEALARHVFQNAPKLKKAEHVLLLEGGSQYRALNYFTDCLEQAFTLRGHHTRRFNLHQNPNAPQQIDDAIKNFKPTFLISFNGMAEAIELSNRKTLGEHLKVPTISWYVDHPFVQYPRVMDHDYPYKINAHFATEGFDNLAKRMEWHKLKAFNTKLHAAGFPDFKTTKPYGERSIRVLVPCSFTPYHEKRQQFKLDKFPSFNRLCQDTIDYLIASPEHPADTFFLDGLERLGINPLEVHAMHYCKFLPWIYHCTEMYWREKLLKAAKNIELTLCGSGWDKADFISDKWTVHPPTDAYTLAEWYGDSQYVWNICPLVPRSVHDRMAFCTANGANLVTEPKEWTQSYFGDALIYMPQEPSVVEERWHQLLNRPIEAQAEQANFAQRFTLTNRTYLNSVLDIEAILDRFALRQALAKEVFPL